MSAVARMPKAAIFPLVILVVAVPAPQLSGSACAQTSENIALVVHPGDDVAGIVAHAPEGRRFLFKPGLYRLLQVSPKEGQSFVGEKGAILSGAQRLTSFEREGALYVSTTEITPGQIHGACRRGRVCDRSHDLFIDDVRQEPVLEKSQVAAGKFFIDYDAHKLYLGGNPTGKRVELSTLRYAFASKAENIRIAGFVIEKYAAPAQMGAVGDRFRPAHWTVENCEVRLNHGPGVNLGDHGLVSHNVVHDNGQLGISGGGRDITVEDNEIFGNNQAGFNSAWEAGGMKLAAVTQALIRRNYVHDNHGPGLWTDIDVLDAVYEDNRIEDNDDAGIQHEISYGAVIRNNRLRGNGRSPHSPVWGAQILVQNSRNVEVAGNRVSVPESGYGIILIEQKRNNDRGEPYLVRNCEVHGNDIIMEGLHGLAAAVLTDDATSTVAVGGNRLDGNTYRVRNSTVPHWYWPVVGNVPFETFRKATGQELHGRVESSRQTP